MSLPTGRCCACKAKIVWARLSGVSDLLPCNPQKLLTIDGEGITRMAWISHIATCKKVTNGFSGTIQMNPGHVKLVTKIY